MNDGGMLCSISLVGVKSVASPVCPLIAAAVVEWFAVPHAVVFEHDAFQATAVFV